MREIAEPVRGAAPMSWCTVVTRAASRWAVSLRTELARRSPGAGLKVLVLDDPQGDFDLATLLGDELDAFTAIFDQSELGLAVLPRLLTKLSDHGPVGYIAAGAQLALGDQSEVDLGDPAAQAASHGVLIDPWPTADAREHRFSDSDRLDALVLAPDTSLQFLLERWSVLVRDQMDEDRTLTTRVTTRWLTTLAESAGLSVGAARVTGARVPHHEEGADADTDADGGGEPTYGFETLPNGLRITRALRLLLRRAHRERSLAELIAMDSAEMRQWLAFPYGPAADLGVSRYLAALHDVRADLRANFPDLDRVGAQGLLAWARKDGQIEDPLLELLSPPAPSSSSSPPPDRFAARPPIHPPLPPWGVNVAAHWRSELGVADAARLLLSALDEAEVPVHPVAIRTDLPPARQANAFAALGARTSPFAINLVAMNPDGLLALNAATGGELFADRLTIGYWWWEVLDSFPAHWRPAFDLVNEVWVGSRHVRDAIAPAGTVPVHLLPIPVIPPAPVSRAFVRSRLGLPQEFLFVTIADYNSGFVRKNPAGVIRAFVEAFPPGSGPALLVKTINADLWPDDRDELRILADSHPDVLVRDGYLPAAEVDALIAAADCVVSLHHAEGFGLPLARALAAGIPAVATAYGGNLDFMTEANSYLVRHEAGVVPPETTYPAGAPWVVPDIAHAAAQMRRVFERPGEARDRARIGAAFLARENSPSNTGARMAARLERIHDALPRGPRQSEPAADVVARDRLARLIKEDPPSPARSPLGPLGPVIRRALFRVMRPIMVRQRLVDEAMLDALARIDDELAAKASLVAPAEVLAAIRRQHPGAVGGEAEMGAEEVDRS